MREITLRRLSRHARRRSPTGSAAAALVSPIDTCRYGWHAIRAKTIRAPDEAGQLLAGSPASFLPRTPEPAVRAAAASRGCGVGRLTRAPKVCRVMQRGSAQVLHRNRKLRSHRSKSAATHVHRTATCVSDDVDVHSYGSPIEDRAGRGREASMRDATTEQTALSREYARIDSTLNWYFNFAEGDVGLQSNHQASVAVLINPKNRSVTNADAAEEAMFSAVEAITRYRGVSAILGRLSPHDRHDLRHCYAGRRWRGELAERLIGHRWFASLAPAVENYLRAHGNGWTPDAGQALLVLAEQVAWDVGELAAIRVEAWRFAERVVGELFARYAAAERVVRAAAVAERDRQRAQFGAPVFALRATDGRPS